MKMTAVKAALLMATFMGVLAQSAIAADASFTYQGVIREVGGGVPAVKNKTVEFRIYDAATGGTALWGRSYSVLLDDNGLFNTALSDNTGSRLVEGDSLEKVLASNAGKTLYIGLYVDGSSGEISPRQALLAVPYAIHAADAASASGAFTVAGKTTVGGGLDVSGDTKVGNLEASSLTVKGNMSVDTSGALSGYGTIPVGCIVMWSGEQNKIPDGWALCNGQTSNGIKTPNLADRFIVGAGNQYSVGNTGGYDAVTLTTDQMPSHSHSMSVRVTGYSGSRSSIWEVYGDEANGYVAGWRGLGTSSAGGGKAHENRPPYYALCFIMRVK